VVNADIDVLKSSYSVVAAQPWILRICVCVCACF